MQIIKILYSYTLGVSIFPIMDDTKESNSDNEILFTARSATMLGPLRSTITYFKNRPLGNRRRNVMFYWRYVLNVTPISESLL